MPRRIMHIDMDAFFAAVELQRHPELAGRPVVVGGQGDPRRRGVVSTATYEARDYGIRSGMALRTAQRLCPQAVFLPVDFETYRRVSRRIKAILRQYSPVMEDVGIDEAYLDISDCPASPRRLAEDIKRRIREETGLSCSIGIAPNKLLAKIASDMDKPDGLTVIGESDIEARIWPLPVRKLWGVGPKTEARLAALGVATIGDLAAVPLKTLVGLFGRAHGAYLHRAARGIDNRPLVTRWQPKSIGRETTFQRDVTEARTLVQTLTALVDEVCARLKARGYRGRRVTVKLRYADFETHTRAETLASASADPAVIRAAAVRCLRRFALDRRVRLIGVRVDALERAGR